MATSTNSTFKTISTINPKIDSKKPTYAERTDERYGHTLDELRKRKEELPKINLNLDPLPEEFMPKV